MGVNDVLFFLVFGESLLNDAVTVVLYNTFKTFQEMEEIATEQYFLAIGAFFTVSLGGVALGVICGLVSCLITKYTSHVRVVEPLGLGEPSRCLLLTTCYLLLAAYLLYL